MLNVYHSPLYLSIINVKINLILSKNSLLELYMLAPLRKIKFICILWKILNSI